MKAHKLSPTCGFYIPDELENQLEGSLIAEEDEEKRRGLKLLV